MLIAGVDEAGRGPLAGPVISAAVILDPKKKIQGLNDSKLLTPRERESLFDKICRSAIAWSIGRAEVEEIDSLNILQASLLSMQRALQALNVRPILALIDGIHAPQIDIPTECIIDGDRLKPAISAASIIAKVTRDREMQALALAFPGFGFEQHKGYGTELHMKALRALGPSPIHRRSFSPVRIVFESGLSYNRTQGQLYQEELNVNKANNEANASRTKKALVSPKPLKKSVKKDSKSDSNKKQVQQKRKPLIDEAVV